MSRLWSLLWEQNNKLDGYQSHIIYENLIPKLFNTRQQARSFAKERYGYIKHRKDLRVEPHKWRMPKPIKIKLEVQKEL